MNKMTYSIVAKPFYITFITSVEEDRSTRFVVSITHQIPLSKLTITCKKVEMIELKFINNYYVYCYLQKSSKCEKTL